MKILIAIVLLLSVAIMVAAPALATERSTTAVAAFKRTHVCPSTGVAAAKPCPGYVVDHIMPLCAGGADAPENMMFMSIADGKKKDRVEAKLCALMKRCRPAAELAGDARSDRPPMRGELK